MPRDHDWNAQKSNDVINGRIWSDFIW